MKQYVIGAVAVLAGALAYANLYGTLQKQQVTMDLIMQKLQEKQQRRLSSKTGASLMKDGMTAVDELTFDLEPLRDVQFQGLEDLKILAEEQGLISVETLNELRQVSHNVQNFTFSGGESEAAPWADTDEVVANLDTIMSSEQAAAVYNLFDEPVDIELHYRASRDMSYYDSFHNYARDCNPSTPCLLVARNRNGQNVFGGYFDIQLDRYYTGDYYGEGNSWQFFFWSNDVESLEKINFNGRTTGAELTTVERETLVAWKDGFNFVELCNGANWASADSWTGNDYNMPTGCSDVATCAVWTTGADNGQGTNFMVEDIDLYLITPKA